MTSLQAPETPVPGTAGEEDPMELSIDSERRFLSEDDIDIDLSVGGRSPYNQEDEYMLEDNTFMEDPTTYDGREDENDDVMVDEVGTPQAMADAPEVHLIGGPDDTTGFDILVDDEDLVDADETMSQLGSVTNHTEQVLDLHDFPPGELPEDHRYFASDDFSIFQTLGNDHDVIQPDHDSLLTTHYLGTNEKIAFSHTQETNTVIQPPGPLDQSAEDNEHSTILKQSISENLLDGSNTQVLSGLDHEHESSLLSEAIKMRGYSDKETEEFEMTSNHSKDGRELITSKPERNTKVDDPSTNTPELSGPKDSKRVGDMIHDVSEDCDTVHHNPGAELTVNGPILATDDLSGRVQHDELVHDTEDHQHPTGLHPVIVVYQDNEISLFPPHEETGEHSATYFLEDESIANASIRALLKACRFVLADSIGEQDELEIKITPLGLDICETCSEASTLSLQQIMNLYLQLQLNDGVHHPDPLYMILTTRLNLPHRLQYLHSAVEEGLGFLDIVIPGSVEVVEAPVGFHEEQSQESLEKTNEEPEELIDQRSTVVVVQDEGNEPTRSSEGGLEDQETGQSFKTGTQDENLAINEDDSNSHDQDQHSNARNDLLGDGSPLSNASLKSIKQIERRSDVVSATNLTDMIPNGPAVSIPISDALASKAPYSRGVDYDGQEEEPQVSSAASSTLRGDISEVAAGEVQLYDLATTSQDERQSREASYEGDDLESSDTIVTKIPGGTSRVEFGSMKYTAGISRHPSVPSIVVFPRKASTSASDIDNNEISYEDRDIGNDEGLNEEIIDFNDDGDDDYDDGDDDDGEADENGDFPAMSSRSVEDKHKDSGMPPSQHDSLKRAREVEDDDLCHEADLQADMKRVRST